MEDNTAGAVAERIAQAIGDDLEAELEPILDEHLPRFDEVAAQCASRVILSLDVQGIRSFGPKQELRLSEGLTLVYAKNGLGKTSLVDAVELLTTGHTTRQLSGGQEAKEVQDDAHVPHVPRDASCSATPEVVAHWLDGSSPGSATWSTFGEPAPEAPDIQVLARRRLRELINAKGVERARALAPAVGLGDLAECWTDVSKALTEQANREWQANTSVERAAAYLDQVLTEVDATESAVAGWAESALQGDPVTSPAREVPDFPTSAEWMALAEEAAFLQSSAPATDHALSAEDRALLRAFLEVAQPGKQCPACEDGTIHSERLGAIRAALERDSAADTDDRRRATLDTRLGGLRADVQAELGRTAPRGDLPPDWTARRAEVGAALASVQATDPTSLHTVAAALDALAAARPTPPVPEIDIPVEDVQKSSVARAAQQDAQGVAQALAALRLDAAKRARLGEASRQVRTRMQAEVEKRVAVLSEPITEWLNILAPEGSPSVGFKASSTARRPKLEIVTESGSHALGYLSDSQLDMLGLAAHLARIERDHPHALVMLDDPTDALDTETRERFIDAALHRLLKVPGDDPPRRQVVILTHEDDVVRQLWEHHRGTRPVLIQLDLGRSDDGTVVEPRSAATSFARAQTYLKKSKEAESDSPDVKRKKRWRRHRLAYRASLAAQTRQALEMLAKDCAMVLGPAGLSRLPDVSETSTLGDVERRVVKAIEDIQKMQTVCGENWHKGAIVALNELRELLSGEWTYKLNPGAHADVVIPEVETCRAVLVRLEKHVKRLTVDHQSPGSAWVTASPFARDCAPCPACPTPPTGSGSKT